MKNTFGAMIDISKAIELDPTNPEYINNRGVIYETIGDRISALQNYKVNSLLLMKNKMATKLGKKCSLAFFNAANI
jgi:Flp pilus assembly protein TadD